MSPRARWLWETSTGPLAIRSGPMHYGRQHRGALCHRRSLKEANPNGREVRIVIPVTRIREDVTCERCLAAMEKK